MVWGQCWPVVLLPIVSLIVATGKVTNLIYSFSVSNLLHSVKNPWSISWVHQYSCSNIPNALCSLHPGNNIMVHCPHHLPHFECYWGSAWNRQSIKCLSLLHWSAGWILSSVFNDSDCIFGSRYSWQFWSVLPWCHSWYCKGVFMTPDFLVIDQTPYVGSSTHTHYWLGSSRTYVPQPWLWWKYRIVTLFPGTFRGWHDKLPRIHHREHSSWNWHWSSTAAVGWAHGSCWKVVIVFKVNNWDFQVSTKFSLSFFVILSSFIIILYSKHLISVISPPFQAFTICIMMQCIITIIDEKHWSPPEDNAWIDL